MAGLISPLRAILFIVFLQAVGTGLILPILPALVERLAGPSGPSRATIYGLVMASSLVIMFLFSQLLGRVSDRYGRRPLLLMTLAGMTLAYLIMSMADSLAVLFAAQAIAGFCAASGAVGRAYIAEVTTPDKRAQSYAIITAAVGLGFILGPVIGGNLGRFGTHMPFYVACGLTALLFLFALFALPESLDPDDVRPFSWRAAMPFASVPTLIKAPPLARGIVLASLIEAFAINLPSEIGALMLFMQHSLQWNTAEIGMWLTLFGIGVAFGQAVVTPLAIRLFGDRSAWLIGSLATALVFFAAGFMYRGWHMYALIAAYALISFVGPVALSLVSQVVPRNQLGEIQGAFISLSSLIKAGAIALGTVIFGYFTGPVTPMQIAGAAFFFGAACQVPAVIYAFVTIRRNPVAGISSETGNAGVAVG
ncbi:MAG: MFS transporter [Pseudomonadota bacterium]